MPFGDRLIVREEDGALSSRALDLTDSVELVPAACAGALRYADASRGKVVVSCRPRGEDQERYMVCAATAGCRDLGPRPDAVGPSFTPDMGDTSDPVFGLLVDLEGEQWVPTAALMKLDRAFLEDGRAYRLNGETLVETGSDDSPSDSDLRGPVRWGAPAR